MDSEDQPSGRAGNGFSDLTEAIVAVDPVMGKQRDVGVREYKNVGENFARRKDGGVVVWAK